FGEGGGFADPASRPVRAGAGVGVGVAFAEAEPKPKNSFTLLEKDRFSRVIDSSPIELSGGRGLTLRASGGSGIKPGSSPPISARVRPVPSEVLGVGAGRGESPSGFDDGSV